MEPPKFRHKKVPRGTGSPPVPVMHSPPRPVTVKDQQASKPVSGLSKPWAHCELIKSWNRVPCEARASESSSLRCSALPYNCTWR